MRLIALRLAVTTFLLVSAAQAKAENANPSPIEVRSELLKLPVRDDAGQAKVIHRLVVLLVNTGSQPVTVLTDGLERSTEVVEGMTSITLGLNATVKKDGHLIVPSMSKLAPVTLQPGEAASVSTSTIDLSKYKDGKMSVSYAVSDFWGKRLSIWSGSATSEAVAK